MKDYPALKKKKKKKGNSDIWYSMDDFEDNTLSERSQSQKDTY